MYSVPRSSLITSLALLAVILAGCEKPASQNADIPLPESVVESPPTISQPPSEPSPPSFPIKKTLTDTQGRPLEGTIVGKSDNSLFVIRGIDGLSFEIPLSSLSPEDREFSQHLPNLAPPAGFAAGNVAQSSPSAKPSGMEAPYVLQRQKEIDQIRIEMLELRAKIDPEGEGSSIQRRSIISEIERKQKEIADLTEAINRYLEDNP